MGEGRGNKIREYVAQEGEESKGGRNTIREGREELKEGGIGNKDKCAHTLSIQCPELKLC